VLDDEHLHVELVALGGEAHQRGADVLPRRRAARRIVGDDHDTEARRHGRTLLERAAGHDRGKETASHVRDAAAAAGSRPCDAEEKP
jgi:hypothetical protein